MLWSKLPLLPVALCFAAGIITSRFFPGLHSLPVIMILVFAWILVFPVYRQNDIYKRLILHILLLSLAFFGGYALFSKVRVDLMENQLPTDVSIEMQGIIVSAPVKSNYRKFILEVYKFNNGGINWNETDCRIMVYVHPDVPSGSELQEGNEIILKGTVSEITYLKNPKAFNYKDFLFSRKIVRQCILQQNGIVSLQSDAYPNVKSWSRIAREYAHHQIRIFTTDEETRAITESILLGINSRIQEEVYADFSNTGTIHILAVSGMHVNIFMFVFLWLSAKIKKRSVWVRLCKVALLCSLVWFYVFLTGSNPSVLRAGLMFSYMIIGNEADRKPSMLNALGFAALCLLIANPFHLFNLSFQFSFLAVLGILVMDPVIKALYAPGIKPIQWLWSYLCISIAAQFFVFPLSVFYFNQFPVYFLLAGIIAVPLGTIILYFGNILILAGSFAVLFKNAFECTVSFFINSISFFAKLPGALSGYIDLELHEMFCWFLMLLFLVLFLVTRKLLCFYILLTLLIINYTYRRVLYLGKMETTEIVIYAVSGGYHLDFFQGCDVISLSSLRLSQKSKSFASSGYRKYKEICQDFDLTPVRAATGNNFSFKDGNFQAANLKLWVPDYRKFKHFKPAFENINYLVISSECKKLKSSHLCDVKVDHLILSAELDSISTFYWKAYALENGIAVIDLSSHGAYHILTNP